MGADGYPKPIFDKRTGVIDHEVAAYWKENYDLRYIMERDWKTLRAEANRQATHQGRRLATLTIWTEPCAC